MRRVVSLVAQMVENLPAMYGRPGLHPWFREDPCEGTGTTPAFLSELSFGQRCLVGLQSMGVLKDRTCLGNAELTHNELKDLGSVSTRIA